MDYEKVDKYIGVYKKDVNGITCYFTRFKFRNKQYPYINLTNKYGVRKPKEAFEKIQVLKSEIRQGLDPFAKKEISNEKKIGELWMEFLEKNESKLSLNTMKQYKQFYNKWLKISLENKKVSEITDEHLKAILNKTDPETNKGLKYGSDIYRSILKKILYPFFLKALEKDYIKKNILDNSDFKFKQESKKTKITEKTNIKHLEIAQTLYKTIDKYESQYSKQKIELKVFMYLFLMTAHRYGELLQLTKDNLILDEKKIKANSDITKTKIITYYPIPEECMEFFNSIENGKLFKNIKYGAIYGIFQRWKTKANLEFEITAHEVRNLLLNSMISLGIDSTVANRACLDHKLNKVAEAYFDIHYEDKMKAYNTYWEALRK